MVVEAEATPTLTAVLACFPEDVKEEEVVADVAVAVAPSLTIDSPVEHFAVLDVEAAETAAVAIVDKVELLRAAADGTCVALPEGT